MIPKSIFSAVCFLCLSLPLWAVELPPESPERARTIDERTRFFVEPRLERANQAIADNDARAIVYLEEAHAIDPENNQISSKLLNLYARHGAYAQGRSLAEKLLSRYPKHPPLQFYLANLEVAAGRTGEAFKLWKHLAERSDLTPEQHLEAVQGYYFAADRLGDWRSLIEAATLWVAVDPDYFDKAHTDQSLAETSLKLPAMEWADWRDRERMRLVVRPKLEEAEQAVARGRLDTAVAIYEEAVANNPRHPRLRGRLFELYQAANKPGDALAVARDLLRDYPNHLPLLFAQARLETSANETSHALEVWDRILQRNDLSDEQRLEAIRGLYFSANRLRDWDALKRAAALWVDMEPDYFDQVHPSLELPATSLELPSSEHPRTWEEREYFRFFVRPRLDLAERHVEGGRLEDAIAIYRDALDTDRNHARLRGRLLELYVAAGQYDEARRHAHVLLQVYPEQVPVMTVLGNIENAMKRPATAASVWQRILNHPDATVEQRLTAARSLYFTSVELEDSEMRLHAAALWAELIEERSPDLREAEAFLRWADALETLEDWPQVVEKLRVAEGLADPAERDVINLRLSYALLKAGEPRLAHENFVLLAETADSPEVRYQAAIQLSEDALAEGDTDASRRWLSHAVREYPRAEDSERLRFQTALAANDPLQTLALIEEKEDPVPAPLLLTLAYQFQNNGYHGLAYHFIRQPEETIEEYPSIRPETYWSNRAFMAFEQDLYEDALWSIEQALEVDESWEGEAPRLEWMVFRVHTLIAMGETGSPLREALRELPQDDVDSLMLANAYLAAERYRTALQIAEEGMEAGHPDAGIYRTRGQALFHLGRFDDAHDAYQAYLRRSPEPDPGVWLEIGYLEEKREEWDLAARAFERVMARDPHDLQARKSHAYVLSKASDAQALDAVHRTIDLESRTLPAALPEERGEIQESLLNFKTLATDMGRRWGLELFATYYEFVPEGRDPFVTPMSGIPSSLGASLSYRPSSFGFRDYRTFDFFVRALTSFKGSTLTPDHDRWQGGIGAEWKPFKTINYVTSFERLFKIGDRSRNGWLWRNRLSYAMGEFPRADVPYWFTLALYGEGAWTFDNNFDEDELALFTGNRIGISWHLRDNLSVTFPQFQFTARQVIKGYEDNSSYYYFGPGVHMRWSQGEKAYEFNRWYVDLFLQYNWGDFLDEDIRRQNRTFEGITAGLRFKR